MKNIIDALRGAKAETCNGADNVSSTMDNPRQPGAWSPMPRDRRVEIMMAGDPDRIKFLGNAVMDIQEQLVGATSKDAQLRLCVTSFLDGCVHTTGFSPSVHDVVGGSARWHCDQTDTRFADAFAKTLAQPHMVDAIVMIGNQFNDDVRRVAAVATQLKDRGSRTFGFPTTRKVEGSYGIVAKAGGGTSLLVKKDTPEMGAIVVQIADYVFRGNQALIALPSEPQRREGPLVQQLRQQMLALTHDNKVA